MPTGLKGRLRPVTPPPLFSRFPELAGRIPWVGIGTFPTPVEPLLGPGGKPNEHLFIKRDDLSAPKYGGNKVRKLEHVLADAQARERRSLVTVGGLGSNQCLATAIYGREFGFEVDVCLFKQPVNQHVVDVLLADAAAGARIRYGGTYPGTGWQVLRAWVARRRAGQRPYYVPPGSTTPLGTLGYVSAGLEFAAQVREGLVPEPDRVFVAAGSCGTVAGLIIGFALAGLKSRCVAVRITTGLAVNRWYIRRLVGQTVGLLRRAHPSFPALGPARDNFDLETRFYGGAYGRETPEARDALAWASHHVKLETTYTGKALAACLEYHRRNPEETLLFWNTFNSAPLNRAESLDVLPEKVQRVVRTSFNDGE